MRYIVSDSLGKPLYWYINDAPKENMSQPEINGQKLLTKYLKDACTVLKSEIDILADSSCNFTEANEKQLLYMLKSIISARKIWQEEEMRIGSDEKSVCE